MHTWRQRYELYNKELLFNLDTVELLTWWLVSTVLIHLVPGSVLLLPDDDFTVVGTGSQNVAEHRVSPRHLPHGTLMATQIQRPKFSSKYSAWNKLCNANNELTCYMSVTAQIKELISKMYNLTKKMSITGDDLTNTIIIYDFLSSGCVNSCSVI